MAQKTKLEIIGPYTPEHEGPFCTRDGRRARIICTDRKAIGENLPILCLVTTHAGSEVVYAFKEGGISHVDSNLDLMNAREVSVAREFWLIGGNTYTTPEGAMRHQEELLVRYSSRMRIIHVREVLPGEE